MSKLEIPWFFMNIIEVDCKNRGFCDVPNTEFILMFHVCKRTIQRWIKHLQKEGIIQVEIDRTIWQSKRIITLANNPKIV